MRKYGLGSHESPVASSVAESIRTSNRLSGRASELVIGRSSVSDSCWEKLDFLFQGMPVFTD